MRLARLVFHELGRTAMQPRTYWVRTLYAAALATTVALAWAWREQQIAHWFQRELLGARLFAVVVWTQLALTVVAAVLSLSGSITAERRAATLPLLLSSPLSSLEIVLLKFLGGILPNALLLLVGLPVLVVVTAFGGVAADQIFGAYALTVAILAVAGSGALLFSTVAGNVTGAILGSLVWMALFVCTPPLVFPSVLGLSGRGDLPSLALHEVVHSITAGTAGGLDPPLMMQFATAGLFTLAALLRAAILLRREPRVAVSASSSEAGSLLWQRAGRASAAAGAPRRLDPLMIMARTCVRWRWLTWAWWSGWIANAAAFALLGAVRPTTHWQTLPILMVEYVLPLVLLAGQAHILLLGASVLVRERSGRLMEVLRSSPLEGRAFWEGKLRVILYRHLRFAAPVWICVAGVIAGGALPGWTGALAGLLFLTDALWLAFLSGVAGFLLRRETWAALATCGVVIGADCLLYGMLILLHQETDLSHMALAFPPYRLREVWAAGLMGELPSYARLRILLAGAAMHLAFAAILVRAVPPFADRLMGRER
jgi:hypothetical protein